MSAATDSPQSLPRVLGPWAAGAILVGCVIGTGVFKKASSVAQPLPGVFLESGVAIAAWVVVGLLTLCGALALAEVAALFPRSGGNLVYLREAYGRLWGFLWGWVEFWFLRCASIAALSVVFADALHDVAKYAAGTKGELIPFWPRQCLSAGIVVLLGALAARGTKLGAGVQVVVTSVKVSALVLIMLLPLIVWAFPPSAAEVVPDPTRFAPVWPSDWSKFSFAAFAAAMVAVLWPYNGWTNVSPLAGEIRDPQRNVPRAFIGGMFVLIAIYTGVNVSYYLAMTGAEMATVGDTPVSSAVCGRLLGPVGLMLASAALMLSVLGTVGGNLLVGPRSVFALSREGLAPAVLGTVHRRYETPLAATVLMTAVTVAFVLAVAAYTRFTGAGLKSSFDVLTDFVVFGSTLLETLAVGTIYVFRVRHKDGRRFRCPGYPVVPAVYILTMLAVLANMILTPGQQTEAFAGLAFIASGALVYLLAVRR
jgi:basic amino acid/polyamine antiporter, APA family